MSVILFLAKFFDNEIHAKEFVRGRVYANTLAAFKVLEGTDDSGRADRHEGTVAWLQPGRGWLEINGMDITDDLAGPTQLQKSWLDHLHVFCLHAAHSGSLDLAKVSNENIEELRQQLIIPDECLALGKHAVVVKNIPLFIRRMEAAAQANNYRIATGPSQILRSRIISRRPFVTWNPSSTSRTGTATRENFPICDRYGPRD